MNDENKKIFDKEFGIEHIKQNCVIYQRADYIEDGEFIKDYSDRFELWSIPQYGGIEKLVFSHTDINEVIEFYKTIL